MADATTRIYELQVKLSQESLRSLKALEKHVGDAAKSLDNFKSMAGGLFDGLVAGASVDAFFGKLQDTISGLDELADQAARLGQSPESFSQMAYAAKLADVEVGELATSMKELNKAIFAAKKEGSKENAIFAALGIDPTGKDTTKVMEEIADKFGEIGEEATKSQVLLELFGKAGLAMRPMMEQGAEGIKAAREEATKFGIVITDDLAKAVDAYDTNTKKLQASTQGLWTDIVRGLLPSILKVQDAFLKTTTSGTDFVEIGKGIGFVFKVIADAAMVSWTQISIVGKTLAGLATVIAAFASGDISSIPELYRAWRDDVDQTAQSYVDFRKNLYDSTAAVEDETKAISTNKKMTDDLNKAMTETNKKKKEKVKFESLVSDSDIGKLLTFEKKLQDIQDMLKAGKDEEGIKLTLRQVDALKDAWVKTYDAKIKFQNAHVESLIADTDIAKLAAMDKKLQEIQIAFETGWTTTGLKLTIQQVDALREAFKKAKEAREELAGLTVDEQIDKDIEALQKAEEAAYNYRIGLLNIIQMSDDLAKVEWAQKLLDALDKVPDAVNQSLEGMDKLLKQIADNTDEYAQAFSGALVDFASSSKSAKDAFGDFVETTLRGLAQMATQVLIVQPLFDALRKSMAGGGFMSLFSSSAEPAANGAVFDAGHRLAFASGGVVTRPTVFPMASGWGLMGEAGPEAIMPLARGTDGKLGVSAAQSSLTVNVINNNGSQIKVEETEDTQGGKQLQIMVDAAVEQSLGKGRFDRVLSTSYGVTRRGR